MTLRSALTVCALAQGDTEKPWGIRLLSWAINQAIIEWTSDFAFRDNDPFGAYGQSKTANVLFAVEATRRWESEGIVANALMPGGLATPLQRHLPEEYAKQAFTAFRAAGTDFKTVEQGAVTSTLLAASSLLDDVGARYFESCNQARVFARRSDPGQGGVAPDALDPANAQRLWDLSLELIGPR